jgi:hypothetical protein
MLVTPQLAEVFFSAKILYKFAKGSMVGGRQLSITRRRARPRLAFQNLVGRKCRSWISVSFQK